VFCQKIAKKNLILPLLVLGVSVLCAASPQAREIKLVKGGIAQVLYVVDGDTVKLKTPIGKGNLISDQIRLVGIQAPKLPLGRVNFKSWPLADVAKIALEKLSLGKKLTLSYGGRRMDRHGRLLAHLYTEDGIWIQGALLNQGMARVYSFPDNRALISEMLAQEKIARAAEKGIWQVSFYRIRQHLDLDRLKNSFQLVEGVVQDVARVRKKIFINFGENWRTDFTISLNARAAKLFDRSGFDPIVLKGKRIRVRGWIKSYNGPMISATHPEQIEVLE
jgi:endonuclease YncB( thermonuclease family)